MFAYSDPVPKVWYCPNCRLLAKFKKSLKASTAKSPISDEALKLDSICVCGSSPKVEEKLLKCHSDNCKNGKFFHLHCLDYKRMPSSTKTTWMCKVQVTASAASTSDASDDDGDDDDFKILQVPKGVIDKGLTLVIFMTATYSPTDSPTGWLDCTIIQQAQVYLQKVNPLPESFQRTTLGPVRNFDIVTSEVVRILHTGHAHWVCISSTGYQSGIVNLYDSLYHDIIEKELEEQVQSLMADSYIGIANVPVQQQKNGSDCGGFAIAFAACLVHGFDPRDFTFDIPKMRLHLAHCRKSGEIPMFPKI